MSSPQRIDDLFARLKKEKRKALVAYLVAGDPDLATTARLVPALVDAGADIIELGIPFSDPLADGVVVGSAIVDRIAKLGRSPQLIPEITAFLRPIAQAVHSA